MCGKCRLIIFIVCLILPIVINAQNSQKLTFAGVVCDSLTGKSLPFCTVLFTEKSDSTKNHGSITNENGEYKVEDLCSIDYIIQYRYIGYKTKIIALNLIQNHSNDTVFLSSNIQTLEAVEVTASIFERDIDKLVMNASQVKLPEGSNAVDLLKEVPGVNITNDNSISLLGKDVLILMDGKPVRIPFDKLSNMLKNQSSNDIGKVEIMFTPPPKYIDEWDGAILNIISKKKLETGFYGTISNIAGYGKHFREDFSVDLNYRKSKVNTFISFGPRKSKKENSLTATQFSAIENNIVSSQDTKNINTQYGYYLSGGISYTINTKSSLDLSYQQNQINDNTNQKDSIISYNQNLLNTLIFSSNDSYRFNKDHEISLFYQNKIKEENHYFSLEGDYSKSAIKFDQNRNYNTYNSNDLINPLDNVENKNSTPTQQDIVFFRADHVIKISKFKIESGLKFNHTKMDNNFMYNNLINDIWVNDTSKSNHFVYDENIFSGYIGIGKQISSKFSLKVTLRGAYTSQLGKLFSTNGTNKKNYMNVLPSVFMSYTMNENNEFTLNYDCTLNRPNFEALNPFKYYDNPIVYFEGNPTLNPAFKNKIELMYRYKSFLFTTISYNRIDDYITLRPVLNISNDKIIGYKYENFSIFEIWKFSSSYSHSLLKDKLNLNFSPSINYSIMNDPKANYNKKATNFIIDISADYTINEKSEWVVSMYNLYMSGINDGFNQMQSFYKSGISMSRSFFKNKLNLMIDLNDIFNSESRNSQTVIDNIVYKIQNRKDSRTLRVMISYSFSSKDVKQYNKHNINNEEKNRNIKN